MSRRPFAALLALLALTACGSAGSATAPSEAGPSRPVGAVAIAPRAAYAGWWTATEQCSGRTGSLANVRFHVMPGVERFVVDGREMVAYRYQRGTQIEIFVAEAFVEHEMVVRHEMLHALLQVAGHPEEFFVQRCGLTWETWAGI